jgi:chemotaxis signal transduction protein
MDAARSARSRGRVERRDSRQYLTFALAGEEYGVDILRVQEVKGWTPVTRLPRLPPFVRADPYRENCLIAILTRV